METILLVGPVVMDLHPDITNEISTNPTLSEQTNFVRDGPLRQTDQTREIVHSQTTVLVALLPDETEDHALRHTVTGVFNLKNVHLVDAAGGRLA